MERNKRKSMIKVRGGFSEKIGLSTCTIKMQTNEFDDRTRTLIGNHLYDVLSVVFSYASTIGISRYLNPSRQTPLQAMSSDFCKDVLSEVLNVSVHLPSNKFYNWEVNYDRFAEIISSAPYNEVLDFLWYVCHWIATHTTSTSFVHEIYNGFNQLFEKEYVGYRFVAGEITPITNSLEIQEIEQACQIPFEGAHVQLQKALGFLSDREHPDYKNSIKESISAVASVCKVIANKPKAELGDALKALIAEGYPIQGALKTGILALYGYTCEAGGIRHAERETESTVTFEEAKFMMVTCSAIVNYLVAEYGKHGAGNA
mgnify:FL=1